MQNQPTPGIQQAKAIPTIEEVGKKNSTVVTPSFTGRGTRSKTKNMPEAERETWEHLSDKSSTEFCGTKLTLDQYEELW
jgi:hypothetical protein